MACKAREEIVGKRFLSVASGFSKLKLGKIAEWGWRAGVIRAATHKDNFHKELQVKNATSDTRFIKTFTLDLTAGCVFFYM